MMSGDYQSVVKVLQLIIDKIQELEEKWKI
jgi:hypothetical protein